MGKNRAELGRERAQPWVNDDTVFLECDFDPKADIEKTLDSLEPGTIVVATMSNKSAVDRRLTNGWIILHEYLPDDHGTVVIARKGIPDSKPLRFYFPYVWQVGDVYVMNRLIDELRSRFNGAEIYTEYDWSFLIDGTKKITSEEAAKVAWDGVYHHDTTKSDLASKHRWYEHYYVHDIEMAKRMGWLPEDFKSDTKPEPIKTEKRHDDWASTVTTEGYVLVAPESAAHQRMWDKHRWNRVVQFLDMNGIPTVIVGRDNHGFSIDGYEASQVTDLSGKTSLGQLFSLIKKARLVLCVDSAPMHVANCMGVPTMAIFGPSVPSLVVGDPTEAITRDDGGCLECYGDGVFQQLCDGRVDCIEAVTTMKVVQKIADRLGISFQHEPTVSACLMVLNERETLPDCLNSLRGFADEIVVVDTGSTDGTLEYLDDRSDVDLVVRETVPQGGIEDFSHYRNIGISRATKKYILWIDACERIKDAEGLKAFVKSEEYDLVSLPIQHANINYNREKIAPRMFAKFVDPIHEFMPKEGLRDVVVPEGMGVLRLWVEKKGREQSTTRNLRILRKLLRSKPIDHPRRPRWLFYIARDLADSKRYTEALQYLNERIMMHGWVEERIAACIITARILLYETKEFGKAQEVAEMMKKLAPNSREWAYVKAEALYWANKPQEAKFWYERCVTIPRPVQSMWVWEEVYTWLPYDRLSRVAEMIGNRDGAIAYAHRLLHMVPSSEKEWVKQRIRELADVSDLVVHQ